MKKGWAGSVQVDGVIVTAVNALKNGVQADTVGIIVTNTLIDIGGEAADTMVEELVFAEINKRWGEANSKPWLRPFKEKINAF